MASRRTRIKGIANIPLRKKINLDNNISNLDNANSDQILTDHECSIKILKEEENTELTQPIKDNSNLDSGIDSFESIEELPSTKQNNVERAINDDTKFRNTSDLKLTEITNDNSIIKNEIHCMQIAIDTVKETSTQVPQIKDLESQNSKASMPRRKFLKPGINLNAVRKRQTTKEIIESQAESLPTVENMAIKHEILEGNEEKEVNLKPTEKVVVISEIRIPKYENNSIPIARDITKIISKKHDGFDQGSYSEVTLNETHLCANEGSGLNSSVVTFSPNIKKVIPETYNVSDSEYPVPPPSPSKINRSRIKAIPRLSQRKTSCSASESEDETRKYGRIRNNSVCSVVSTSCLEPPTPTSESVPPKDVPQIFPKKIIRTEQSRKLAEARREFQKRFGTNSPDKQKLKMIDLIFYNPTSNPMSKKNTNTSSENDITKTEKDSEENVDDPPKVNIIEEKEKDADNGMPVPQIKIGPSGEIILDEQSLIVENVEVARQKEQIRNSQLVNGDFDTGYGIYKRAPRALTWSQKETLRFYKSLNLIGTDFTVMTQLFPKRSRRELKIKFKKEERINKQLIDRAIMQPCNYNFADLKREIEIEEEEEAALQKLKEEEIEKMKQEQLDKLFKRGKKRKETGAEAEKSLSKDVNLASDSNKDTIILPLKKRLKGLLKPNKVKSQPRKSKAKLLNIKSVLDDDSDADISDMETHSESEEEETIPFLKPTRSGRMPKSTMRYTTIVDQVPKQSINDTVKTTPSDETLSKQFDASTKTPDEPPQKPHNAIRHRRSSSLSSIESNSDKLVPGSVVIMVDEDSDSKFEYKVFMVTPEKKMAPLDLDSEIVARLVKEKQNEDNAEFLVPSIPEKNVTIPATSEKDVPESQQSQEILYINCPDTAMTE